MFIVILFIFLGISVGYIIRTKISSEKQLSIGTWAGRTTTWLIWTLLFMLGIEVGSNEQIIKSLPTLGVEALVLSICGTLGSYNHGHYPANNHSNYWSTLCCLEHIPWFRY